MRLRLHFPLLPVLVLPLLLPLTLVLPLPLVLVAVRVLRVGLVGVPVAGLHGACRLRPWQLIGQSRGGGRTVDWEAGLEGWTWTWAWTAGAVAVAVAVTVTVTAAVTETAAVAVTDCWWGCSSALADWAALAVGYLRLALAPRASPHSQ